MTADIVKFPHPAADIPPEEVIEAAPVEDFSEVFILGTLRDDCFYFAASTLDPAKTLFHLEMAKKMLLEEL